MACVPVGIRELVAPTHLSNWLASGTLSPPTTSSRAEVGFPLIVNSTHHSLAKRVCCQLGSKLPHAVVPPPRPPPPLPPSAPPPPPPVPPPPVGGLPSAAAMSGTSSRRRNV